MIKSDLTEQLEQFKALLARKQLSRTNPIFPEVVDWLKRFPTQLPPIEAEEVKRLMCDCFALSEVEFLQVLRGNREEPENVASYATIERELDALIPSTGFLRHYVDYTRNLESPLAYHLYCALGGVGAVVNRQVFINMGGQFKVYPAMGIMILGPSGVKKTTASDVIVGLIQEANLIKVYQEKITPEGLVEAMKGDASAVGLVYAPEMSVFLGKQRYMEGVIPLITRFMDCPSTWASATIMRGNSVLHNIGISCLFCSTADWFIKNTPADTFGGGFIARYILVVQHGSPRVFPIPVALPESAREQLLAELTYIHSFEGAMTFSPEVYHVNGTGKEYGRYAEWYREYKSLPKSPEYELLSTYLERKPIHVLRIAMVIHLATHQDLELCTECFERSVKLCGYMEKFLPSLMQQMFKSSSGEEQDVVLNAIKKAGGVITHTELVRRLQYRMKAVQTKAVVDSLKEAEVLKEVRDTISRRYILVEHK